LYDLEIWVFKNLDAENIRRLAVGVWPEFVGALLLFRFVLRKLLWFLILFYDLFELFLGLLPLAFFLEEVLFEKWLRTLIRRAFF